MESTFGAEINMVVGDFNADGSYFDEDAGWSSVLAQMPRYSLLTGNDLDTTVAQSSNTYDRILATSSLAADSPSVYVMEQAMDLSDVKVQGCDQGYINEDVCAGTDWVEVAKELSDHYPVELGA